MRAITVMLLLAAALGCGRYGGVSRTPPDRPVPARAAPTAAAPAEPESEPAPEPSPSAAEPETDESAP